ncbi:BREX-3 system P-loop-containing protein BrxF [Bacillus altitudinis]|uniref:BREX-3 system P-loop-containing protein BrxF n=1 Tax=Bacillus altitudinis TaxID=293387 RepID=UPI0024ADA165|nr:BREX-3 system P-loop-containing protein BrxF [Bacillus altitudinis]MDI4571576.1 BREX-3 system P-loop-containing protein BrxF [Bacillus altitudinis]MEC3811341.1 BREX-3 system P-loop-containing protein BrxF [Bacillus altitudinis]
MSLRKQLETNIEAIKGQRYQFLLLSFQANIKSKITVALKEVGASTFNLNLLLANKLKELPISKRKRAVKDILREALNEVKDEVVYFERIEYLFDEELNQDPLKLFEYLSGNKVLLINWPGDVRVNGLSYGTPGHPEYYQVDGYQDHLVAL